MKNKRKIIAVSGARSEYDLLYSVYDALDKDERFDFGIIITGPNLSDTFGYTAKNIENDGFKIIGKVFNLVDSNQKIGRINSIGYQIPSLANLFYQERPDIVLIAGDREEAISVTLTCAYLDIPVAHFFGGDIAKDGNIDNSVRYAASKFAHIHFPTLEKHKETLLKLGEDENRIFVVGNPALDRIMVTPILERGIIFKNLSIENKNIQDYCVLIQHSIISQVDQQDYHIRQTLEAIRLNGMHCFINYPNSDAGFDAIVKAYNEYANKYPLQFTLFKNLDRLNYINLLRNAKFLIGNSSSGIVEVASFGLPAINVGARQKGRIHGKNVVFVDNEKEEITEAINKVTTDKEFISEVKKKYNPYGDGHSTEKVIEVLANISIDDKLVYKNITY
ncbi:UDP-N-acetylglucosamine 2-epimerase [Sphingobacterium luzhongxinii]|uniref:UDP-N-acetylglucosamine 2-epimerase n=1 Tax=Sphingobacterium luzhongxinii TaxID=2654181 RepID=UPI0013D92A25|nr:UDP-N-acetylglucosamine 2-epimerase [Sphingobacterium sp. xlx-73]